jgi:hypothetical protein
MWPDFFICFSELDLEFFFCRRLALSTNNIDRMISLAGMSKLKILSLGRNLIKKVSAVLFSLIFCRYYRILTLNHEDRET